MNKLISSHIFCLSIIMLGAVLIPTQALSELPSSVSKLHSGNPDNMSAFPELGDIQAQYNSENLDMLGDDIVGDHIDIDTGALSFARTDVSLPGNNSLPVSFGRTLSRSSLKDWMGDWMPAIPYMSRRYLANPGASEDRCTGKLYPDAIDGPVAGKTYSITPASYFDGIKLSIPGRNPGAPAEMLPNGGSPEFANSGARMVTKNNWKITCTTDTSVPPVENFIAHAPNGDKYTFGFIKNYFIRTVDFPAHNPGGNFGTDLPNYYNETATHSVYEEVLYVTRIEDVHGNWVEYDYAGGRPNTITSNDGRTISLEYALVQSDLLISKVKANGRVWGYNYTVEDNKTILTSVTEPDHIATSNVRAWTINADSTVFDNDLEGLCALYVDPAGQPHAANGSIPTVSITHPSGTKVEFAFAVIKNGRSKMQIVQSGPDFRTPLPSDCFIGTSPGSIISPTGFYSFAVVSKTVSVLNGPTYIWKREYEEDDGGYIDEVLIGTKKRTIEDPEGHKTVFYVNREYGTLEGSLMKTEVFPDGSSTPIRTTTNTYYSGNLIGLDLSGRSYSGITNNAAVTRIYKMEVETEQDGSTFATNYEYAFKHAPGNSGFAFGSPTEIRRSSDIDSLDRITTQTYLNLRVNWLLALPLSTSTDGLSNVDKYYGSGADNASNKGLMTSQYRFNEKVADYTYYPSGTAQGGALKSVTDNGGYTLTLQNWMRGKPSNILRPDGTSSSQTIDANGWVTRTVNARGKYTDYLYDVAGRPTRIKQQGGSAKTIAYQFFADSGSESKLHKQTITQWNASTDIYRDSLMRTRRTHAQSMNWEAITDVKYDQLSRPIFTSRPAETEWDAYYYGVDTAYDALGRTIYTEDTTDSNVRTDYTYLSGNRVQITDAVGNVMTTKRSGYDGPGGGDVLEIVEPGRTTTMLRNVRGELLSTTQTGTAGLSGTVTHKYDYNPQRRLCREYTPEQKETRYTYNSRGLVETYIKGQDETVSASGDCGSSAGSVTSADAYVSMSYDAMRRTTSIDFADPNTPDITNLYDANGNLIQTDRGESHRRYEYEDRDLVKSEIIRTPFGGVADIDYLERVTHFEYNGNGHKKYYKWGRTELDYDLDGFGRPYQINILTDDDYSFPHAIASQVIYHPDGSIKSARLGNGASRERTIDNRQLTLRDKTYSGMSNPYSAGNILDLEYGYDDLGRIISVTDHKTPSQSRQYGYDGLSQLTSATGPTAWGQGSYSYDGIGNLTSKTIFGRTVALSYGSDNRLSHYTDGGVTKAVSHDHRGNMNRLVSLSPDRTNNYDYNFTYDYSDQPVKVTGGPEPTVDYHYDGRFKRFRSISPLSNGKYNFTDSGYSITNGKIIHRHRLKDVEYDSYQPKGATAKSNWDVYAEGSSHSNLPILKDNPLVRATNVARFEDVDWDKFGYAPIVAPLPIVPNAERRSLNDDVEADNDHSGIGLDLEADPDTGEIESDKSGLSVDRAFPGPQHPQYVNTFFSEVVDYVYLGGELLVRIERTNDLGDRRFIYQHNDQVGTVAVTTDYNGSGGMGGMGSSVAILSDEFASPFGEVDAIQTSQKDRVNFAGHVRDEHTQLTYMQARLYSPVIGRFLSVDPVGVLDTQDPRFFNRYSYTFNDPVNLTDPNGENPMFEQMEKNRKEMFTGPVSGDTFPGITISIGIEVDNATISSDGGGGTAGVFMSVEPDMTMSVGTFTTDKESVGVDLDVSVTASVLIGGSDQLAGGSTTIEGDLGATNLATRAGVTGEIGANDNGRPVIGVEASAGILPVGGALNRSETEVRSKISTEGPIID